MRRGLRTGFWIAAGAAIATLTTSLAHAGGWGFEPPNVIIAEPNTVIVVPPLRYVSPTYHQMFIVNQGPVYDGPAITLPRPGYLPGGYDDGPHHPYYPYVSAYRASYGSYGYQFGAPAVRPYASRYHWRHHGTYRPLYRASRDSYPRYSYHRHHHLRQPTMMPPFAGSRYHRHAPRLYPAPGPSFSVKPKPVWPRHKGRAPQRWTHSDLQSAPAD